jgi:hypothetical protein
VINISNSDVTINMGGGSVVGSASTRRKPTGNEISETQGTEGPDKTTNDTSKLSSKKGLKALSLGNGPTIELFENAKSKVVKQKTYEGLDRGDGGSVTFASGDTVMGYASPDGVNIVAWQPSANKKGKTASVEFWLEKDMMINGNEYKKGWVDSDQGVADIHEAMKDGDLDGISKLPPDLKKLVNKEFAKAEK